MTRIAIITAVLITMVSIGAAAADIHYAVVSGDIETVTRLLDEDPSLIELPDGDGSLPLHTAAYYGDLDMTRLLIERGAEIDAGDNDNSTPLISAALRGHLEIARLLVEQGASVSHHDNYGNSPMMSAARSGNVELIAYLIEKGGSIEEQTEHGSTLLHLAVVRGHPEMTRYLLEQGIDVNISPDPVRAPMPIIRAFNFGNTEIARILLEFGADIDYADPNYGYSFLHMAAIRGDSAMARIFLDFGADVSKLDKTGKPPLYYAVRYSNPTVAALLRGQGAEVGEQEVEEKQDLLSVDVETKDAVVWYLSHSAWAVKTANHFLIFDYYIPPLNPDIPSLSNGRIVPDEIKDLNVVVFSSHEHGDHYDSYILEWQEVIPEISYVFGHEPKVETEYLYAAPGTEHALGDITIRSIPATDAGVGFLVEVDSLTIFHAGDHANGKDELQAEYTDQIDYLANLDTPVDIAFLPITGCSLGTPETVRKGVAYALKKLNPRVYFPQHAADSEYLFLKHADWVRQQGYQGQVGCAQNSGDNFHYCFQMLQ